MIPQTKAQKTRLNPSSWMVFVVFHSGLLFLWQKMVLCQETVTKLFFLAVVKLHYQTSEYYISHN